MSKHWSMVLGGVAPALTVSLFATPAMAELFVAYPPVNHTTVSDKIFFIGTGSPGSDVLINGMPIAERSPAGHFAPSLPLNLGQNQFTLTQGNESIILNTIKHFAVFDWGVEGTCHLCPTHGDNGYSLLTSVHYRPVHCAHNLHQNNISMVRSS